MKNPLRLVDKKGIAILLGSFVLLTLISVIAIVVSVSARDRKARIIEEERRRRETQALASSTSFGMEDFFLDARNPDAGVTYPVREPKRFWTEEEVQHYWIDPSEAGLETLREDNDAKILDTLDVMPEQGVESP